jgi:hypothetical protein
MTSMPRTKGRDSNGRAAEDNSPIEPAPAPPRRWSKATANACIAMNFHTWCKPRSGFGILPPRPPFCQEAVGDLGEWLSGGGCHCQMASLSHAAHSKV